MNKPKIRFKGFEGEWKERRIGDICNVSTGKSNTQDKVDDGKFPFYVRSPHIEKSNKYLYDEEAVLTVGDGVGTGKVFHYVNGKYDLHQRVYRLYDFKGVNALCFYYYFSQKFYKRVMAMTAKSSVDSVRLDFISEMHLPFPSLPEQRALASYFTALDAQIAASTSRLSSLKQIKAASLLNMFPQKGETVPRVRFKGFQGEWKEKALGDVVDDFKYGINAAAVSYDGENKYLRITDIDEESRAFIKDELTSPDVDLSSCNEYIMQEGDIVIARTGASVGKSYIYHPIDGKVYFAGFLIRARVNKKVDREFVYLNTLTDGFKKYIRFVSQRSGQPGVNAEELKSYLMNLPASLPEQRAIASYFTALDAQITLHRERLEKLKQIKAACLEKMFA